MMVFAPVLSMTRGSVPVYDSPGLVTCYSLHVIHLFSTMTNDTVLLSDLHSVIRTWSPGLDAQAGRVVDGVVAGPLLVPFVLLVIFQVVALSTTA